MTTKKKNAETPDVVSKFNIIEKIVALLSKYGYRKVISALLIFMMFIATVIVFTNQRTIIEKILKEQKIEIEQKAINRINFRINEVNPRVDAILYQLLAQTKADRAFVIEMHNGTDNTTGLPFVFGDMTYEKLANDSTESILMQYEKVNLSNLPLSSYLIKNKKFVGNINELTKIDPRLGKKMKFNNAEYVIIYGLRTIDVEIGWVGITYCGNMNIDVEKAESYMLDSSQKLSIILDISNNMCEKDLGK